MGFFEKIFGDWNANEIKKIEKIVAEVEKLDENKPIEEIYAQLRETSHSRLPVINSKGNLIGVILIRAFFREYVKKRSELDLVDLLDTPYFVRPDMPVDELLLDLSKSRTHIAFVSERSDILGIITVEDILEELVGEIFDEYDHEASEAEKEANA